MGEHGQGAAGMGENEGNVGIAGGDALQDQVGGDLGGLEGIVHQHARQVPAIGLLAGRIAGVNEGHDLAAVQLRIEGLEIGMADVAVVHAGQQAHALQLQLVVDARQFLEGGVHIRQGQEGEGAEARGGAGHQLRQIIIEAHRQIPGLGEIAEPDAGRGIGDHGGADAFGVHQRQRRLRRPFGKAPIGRARDPGGALHVLVELGQEMVVNVDTALGCGHDLSSVAAL